MTRCPKCDHEVFETDYACMNCGADLMARTPQPAETRSPTFELRRSNDSRAYLAHLVGSLLKAVAVLGLGGLLLFGMANRERWLNRVSRSMGPLGEVQVTPPKATEAPKAAAPARPALQEGSADPSWRKSQEPSILQAARSYYIDHFPLRPEGMGADEWRQRMTIVTDQNIAAGVKFRWSSNNTVVVSWKNATQKVGYSASGWVGLPGF